MATIALQGVGAAVGGPIGGMVGAIIGGVIDSALFGPSAKDSEGPRLTDLSVSTSTYGSPIPLVYGPQNRLSVNIIWTTGLIETATESEQSGGGKGGGGGGAKHTDYSYRMSVAFAISGRKGSTLSRIFANSKVIYDARSASLPAVDDVNGQTVSKSDGTHTVMDTLHFYNGSQTQIPDTLIEAYEGVGNVPAYRGVSYVVLKDLQLADFGNRTPNFEVEFAADNEISAGGIIYDMANRANVGVVSTSHLSDVVKGFIVSRQSDVYKSSLPLGLAFNFYATEQNGQIRFIKKGRSMKGIVPLSNMGARNRNNRAAPPITYKNVSETDMPSSVFVSFKDEDFDYQPNSQSAIRIGGNAVNKSTVELPIVMGVDQARRIADRLLWGAWSNKRGASFSVSDQYHRINPGDIIGVPTIGDVVEMSVINATRGNNGVINIDATYEDTEIYNSNAIGADSVTSNVTVSLPGNSVLVLIDGPKLISTDVDTGFYMAVTGDSAGWRGANIMRSTDGGVTYDTIETSVIKSPTGTITGTLGAGQAEVFDEDTTLTVVLTNPTSELESKTELQTLSAGNVAWIGPQNGGTGEIIQFKNAVLTAPQTYELSGLLRGRMGTEYAMNSHGSGEYFALLKRGIASNEDFGLADLNKDRKYKAVSLFGDEVTTPVQDFTNTGVRGLPLSPVHPSGIRDTSNNLTISWVRRSRDLAPGLGYGSVPLGEDSEAYEIDILLSSTVVRTIKTTNQSATYLASEQTIDGIAPGDYVDMVIYQISDDRGRGFGLTAKV